MVTGAASYWGHKLCGLLLDNTTHCVIGVDLPTAVLPPDDRLDFVTADTRNPRLADLMALEQVDTLYYLDQPTKPGRFVAGLKNLLACCAQAGVAHLVWVSSTAVYGPHPSNAAFISEDQNPYTRDSGGVLAELIAGEQLCFTAARQWPALRLTVLRPAHIVGPTAPSPLNRYLAGAAAPMLLGFDPLLQLLPEQDLLHALQHALEAEPLTAVSDQIPPNLHQINIATEGLLPLTRLLSLTHTLPLPLFHPLAYWSSGLLRATPWQPADILPYGWDFLRYRCVGATERQTEWGFTPQHSSLDAISALAAHKQGQARKATPSDLAQDEQRLQETVKQRQQAKEKRGVAHE